MCVRILHCERPWLTAKLKDQGWDYPPTNSVIYCSTAQFNHSSDGQKISSCRSYNRLNSQPIFLQLVFFTDSVYLSQGKECSSISLTEQQTLLPVRGKSRFIGTCDSPDIGQSILIHCLPKIVIILEPLWQNLEIVSLCKILQFS